MNNPTPPQDSATSPSTGQSTAPSAARRRLLQGGLVGAPVVLTAVSTPVMATTCVTPSRMASMHASANGRDQTTCTTITSFAVETVLGAMNALSLSTLVDTTVALKTKKTEKVFKALKDVKEGKVKDLKATLTDTLEVINPTDVLSDFGRLLVLTYLNVATPSTNFHKVISLEDVRRMADGSYTNVHVKPQDIEPYLCSLCGVSSARDAKIHIL